jgi:hypothetical protein
MWGVGMARPNQAIVILSEVLSSMKGEAKDLLSLFRFFGFG